MLASIFGYSNTERIALHKWKSPVVKAKRKELIIRLVPINFNKTPCNGTITLVPVDPAQRKPGGLFVDVLKTLRDDERLVILGMYKKLIYSDFDVDMDVQLKGLFEPSSLQSKEKERQHPDYTGNITIVVPRNYKRCIRDDDEDDNGVLYQPKTNDNKLKYYAGLETAIMESRSIQLPKSKKEGEEEEEEEDEPESSIEVFAEKDPLVQYVLYLSSNKLLVPDKGDMVVKEDVDGRYYHMSCEYLKGVRQFYKDTILDEIRYTRLEDAHIVVDLPLETQQELHAKLRVKAKHELPNIVIAIEYSYLHVVPGNHTLAYKETLLK